MELKPCPFCGSPAKTATILGRYGIKCPKCFVSMRAGMYEDNASIIKTWNTRPEQNKKLVEAVKGLSNYLYDTQFVSKDEEAKINTMIENIDLIISEIEGE